jgi:hypothetical protein
MGLWAGRDQSSCYACDKVGTALECIAGGCGARLPEALSRVFFSWNVIETLSVYNLLVSWLHVAFIFIQIHYCESCYWSCVGYELINLGTSVSLTDVSG